MFNIQSKLKLGDGKLITAYSDFAKILSILQRDGTTSEILLDACKHVPGYWEILLSITKALQNNQRETRALTFDHILHTENGLVVGIYVKKTRS
jgi:hypothetical protein